MNKKRKKGKPTQLCEMNMVNPWKTAIAGFYCISVLGVPKKIVPQKWRKNAQKNEDDLVESWKFGTCATTLWCFLFQKNIFPILIYIADMAN